MVSLGTQAEEVWYLALSQTAEFFLGNRAISIATRSVSQEAQFASIGECLRDDVGFVLARGEGAREAAAEVDHNNPDAGIHG